MTGVWVGCVCVGGGGGGHCAAYTSKWKVTAHTPETIFRNIHVHTEANRKTETTRRFSFGPTSCMYMSTRRFSFGPTSYMYMSTRRFSFGPTSYMYMSTRRFSFGPTSYMYMSTRSFSFGQLVICT